MSSTKPNPFKVGDTVKVDEDFQLTIGLYRFKLYTFKTMCIEVLNND